MFFSPLRLLLSLSALWTICPIAAVSAPPTPTLVEQITGLFSASAKAHTENQPEIHIRILTPEASLSTLCPKPELRLTGQGQRLTGNHSVSARCGDRQRFLQVHVSATGIYWVATHPLTPAQTISTDDIRAQHGELEHLPPDIIQDPTQITGNTLTRHLRQGQAITAGQIRQPWVILAGKEVDITAPGNGFSIRARGKALDNAAQGQALRIQTRSGQVLTATATGNEKVTINLKE